MAKPIVAIVEGDPMIALLMNEFLTEEGYKTQMWTKSENAVQFVRDAMPDVLVLDQWIQRRGDGWNILQHLRQDPHTTSIPVIICATDLRIVQKQIREAPNVRYAHLQKPFAVADFLALVKQCLHTPRSTVMHESPQLCTREQRGTLALPIFDGIGETSGHPLER